MPIRDGDVRVACWHIVLQTPKMSARRLFRVGLRRIRYENTARDFVDRGGGTRSHYGRGRAGAEERSSTLSPQVLKEIAKVEAEIDLTEAQAIERLAAPPDNQIQQIELLGKLMLYDKDLS